jgi:DNA-binding LacI/PurR family transcriptional regulator
MPKDTLTTYIHVLRSGLRVPRDVSIISADSNSLLERAVPELTRYRVPALKLAARIVRISQALLADLPVPSKPNLIVPTFVTGSTLSHWPADKEASKKVYV